MQAWVTSLEEEFFRQGDLEKDHDLPASPLMDRSKNGITQTQAGLRLQESCFMEFGLQLCCTMYCTSWM